MQEIKNFIEDKNVFNDIKNILTGREFPWHFYNHVASIEDNKNFFFNHMLYRDNEHISNYFNRIASPILGRLKYNYLIRSKVNLFTRNEKHIQTGFHVDYPQKHKVALFSVNTCNGYTLFKNGDKIYSEENKILIFDGEKEHASVSQTDTKQRININFNFTI
tara:strand:+ start:35 stop:520 length:486 start_codon:yes stop_codon:yes gene_type:complete